MATAYTPILQLALPVTGELNGTWGDVVNNNITSMVEQAIAGLAAVSTWTTASHTLTTANGTTDEARCAVLECSGAPGAAATVICPAFSKVYIIKNSVSGGYAVTLKTSAGNGISVPNGSTALLYCDGTNVVSGLNAVTALTINGLLTVNGQGYSPNIALTDAATVAWDTSTGQVATFTFVSTNRTMGAPTNLKNGAFYALAVIQNSGSNTLTWNAVFKWAAGAAPTLSTAAGAKDYFTFRSDGTNLYQQGISQAVA
jgi:hypothetical protein